jgi:hypothetical protein
VIAGEAFVGGSRNIEYSSSFDDEAVEFISEWDGLQVVDGEERLGAGFDVCCCCDCSCCC